MVYFTNVTSFIHMGGYADYVWPAYAIFLAVVLVNFVSAKIVFRSTIKKLKRKYARTS